MSRFKAASSIALAHISKLLVHLYIMKQIALYHGPEGLGFLGNFISLIALSSTLAGGGIISGIIKYTAEYSRKQKRQSFFWGSALMYTGICSIIVVLLGCLFVHSLSNYVFLSEQFKNYIYFFLFIQIIISANNFAFGVLNGLKNTHLYSILVFLGNGVAFIVACYAIPNHGFLGAIIAISSPAVASFIPLAAYALMKKKSWRIRIKMNALNQDGKALARFSIMSLSSTLCFPLVEMTIRNMIVERLTIIDAGYWQGTARLSMAYLSFFSLFLSFYFVPRVAEIKEQIKLILEVRTMMTFIIALFIPMILVCYLCKAQLVSLVFSSDFLPIQNWLLMQMVGDLFRVLGWIVGFIVVAKACTKIYVIGELAQGGVFILLTFLQLNHGKGIEGVVFASMMTNTLYCFISFLGLFLFLFISRFEQPVLKNGAQNRSIQAST